MNYIVKAIVKSKKDTKDISKNDKTTDKEKTKNKNKKTVKFKRNSVTVINKNRNNLNITENNNNEEEKIKKDNKPNKRQSVIIPKNPPKIKKTNIKDDPKRKSVNIMKTNDDNSIKINCSRRDLEKNEKI